MVSVNLLKRASKPKPTTPQEEKETPTAKTYLPYVKGTTDRISKILRRHNIETTFKADRKISTVLRNPKTKIPLENQGVYEIPCLNCERTYIGQTNRRVNARRDEHKNSVRKDEKTSSLAQHVKETSHTIDFSNTKLLANIEYTKTRIIREAIEIEKHPNNLNSRDDTQRLPTAWKPALTRTDTNKKHQTNTSTSQTSRHTPSTSSTTRNHAHTRPRATERNANGVYNHHPNPENVSLRITRSRSRQLSQT